MRSGLAAAPGNLLGAVKPFADNKAPAPTMASELRNPRRPVPASAARFRRSISRTTSPPVFVSGSIVLRCFPKCLSPDNVDHIRDVAGEKPSDVLLDHWKGRRGISLVKTREMRRQDNILNSPQRML